MDPKDIEKRADELLDKLTLEEKIFLLSGKDDWHTAPIQRLGIPSITMTDGPHGVRATNAGPERKEGPTTSFPTGISMAASWNTSSLSRWVRHWVRKRAAWAAISCSVHASISCATRWVGEISRPIRRTLTWQGALAVAMINGVQSRGVGTSLKHYALNNYEIERDRASSNVDERTLREIYLPQFEMAVKEAHPWTVMCSYNRINGIYASQNDTHAEQNPQGGMGLRRCGRLRLGRQPHHLRVGQGRVGPGNARSG